MSGEREEPLTKILISFLFSCGTTKSQFTETLKNLGDGNPALSVYICVCPKYCPFSIAWDSLRIPLLRMSFRGQCLVAPGRTSGSMILRAFLLGEGSSFMSLNHNPY